MAPSSKKRVPQICWTGVYFLTPELRGLFSKLIKDLFVWQACLIIFGELFCLNSLECYSIYIYICMGSLVYSTVCSS